MYVHGIRRLFDFPGYVIAGITMSPDLVEVRLERDKRFRLPCPACGGSMAENRPRYQTARDLPLGSAIQVLLVYPAIQGRCSHCGCIATIRPPGIHDHARATDRLMRLLCRLARYLPLSHAGEVLGIDAATAGRWDRIILQAGLPPPKLDGLRILLIDEKAVRKRHGYVTLVMNGQTGELLYLAEGKKKESLKGFFDRLGKAQKASIEAVAMDRAGAYHQVVKDELPQAAIVFDKFHLIANYHEVMDEIRRQEWHKASAQDKGVIKGQRFNLFRNPENRTAPQTRSLMNLLHINRNLAVAHILRDALRQVWTYTFRTWAEKYLDKWVRWTFVSGIEALKTFGRSVLKAKEEILNFCDHPITLGPLESFNNTVSRIIHRACGVSDLDYLFLKLRQESLDFVPQK